MASHGAFVLSVASAGLGGVLVALAVLLGVVDAQVWAALTDAGKRVEWVVAPSFGWFAILSLAVWAFVGYGVHAGFAWGALRRTAAGVAFTAALALPLLVPVVGYQVWRLVDARIAVGQPGLTPPADATPATSLANGQTLPTTTPPPVDPSAGTGPSTTGTPAATTLLSPPARGWGVVLIDPLIDDSLNLREWPGVNAPILAAVSPAFANFVWVAVHDPADNPDFGGLDWRTWLIYLELDGDTPKVVGVQEHGWVP